MENVLVNGAGGFIGGHLVRRLKAEGYWVRGTDLKRHEFQDPSADEFLRGDLRDPAFVKQAVSSGVGRFVVLSGRGAERFDEGYGQDMAAAEQAVRDSGVPWTIIRPNNFNQNFDEDLWHAPLRSGR